MFVRITQGALIIVNVYKVWLWDNVGVSIITKGKQNAQSQCRSNLMPACRTVCSAGLDMIWMCEIYVLITDRWLFLGCKIAFVTCTRNHLKSFENICHITELLAIVYVTFESWCYVWVCPWLKWTFERNETVRHTHTLVTVQQHHRQWLVWNRRNICLNTHHALT